MKLGERIYRYTIRDACQPLALGHRVCRAGLERAADFQRRAVSRCIGHEQPSASRARRSARPLTASGTTTIFGHTFNTTGWLGWTDDGMGDGRSAHFPAGSRFQPIKIWPTAGAGICSSRWVAVDLLACVADLERVKGNLRDMILRPSDLPKLWPMQAYYLRLRKEPPPHGVYNPLQKAAYIVGADRARAARRAYRPRALARHRRDRASADRGLRRAAVRAARGTSSACWALIAFFAIHTFQVRRRASSIR